MFMVEFPEAELIRKHFTLRQMNFPPEVAMTKRSLLSMVCSFFWFNFLRRNRAPQFLMF